jgi:hypothetical protein
MCTKFWLESLKGRPLRRPRHRWDNNIKVDLWEVVCEGVELIHLAQDRDCWWVLMNAVMELWVA